MDRQRGRTLIPLLTKLAAPKPDDWYKHVDQVQRYLNSTISRSTGKTPFQLLVGVEMQIKENAQVRRLIDEEWAAKFEEQRRELREDAKRKIAATQEENRKNFNKRRKSAKQYLRGDLVAIKRTQFGPGLKLGGKFLGRYRVSRTMRNDRYMVEKVGEHEGPAHTSTTADFMKPWVLNAEDDASDDSETEDHI